MVKPRGQNRDKLLASGLELLSQNGYAATGVQEITAAAGVPKGSFYNYFDSKEDFAIAVLSEYQAAACDQLDGMLGPGDLAPLDRLATLFSQSAADFAAGGFTGGCLAGRLAQELAGENTSFRAPLDHVFGCMQKKIAHVLDQAQEQGQCGVIEDTDSVAEFIVNAWQGAAMRAKAAGSDRPLEVFQRMVFSRLLPPVADA